MVYFYQIRLIFATSHMQHIPISFRQKTYCYNFSILGGIPNYNIAKENDWVHTFPNGFVLKSTQYIQEACAKCFAGSHIKIWNLSNYIKQMKQRTSDS